MFGRPICAVTVLACVCCACDTVTIFLDLGSRLGVSVGAASLKDKSFPVGGMRCRRPAARAVGITVTLLEQ